MSTRLLIALLLVLSVVAAFLLLPRKPARAPGAGSHKADAAVAGSRRAPRIRGLVLADNVPVEHADVELQLAVVAQPRQYRVRVHEGAFEIDNIEAGTYLVFASDPELGYSSAATVVGPPGGDPQVTLHLRPWGTVTGLLVSETGKPIAGADLRAIPLLHSCAIPLAWQPASATSGPDGTFVLKRLPQGHCRLTVRAQPGGEATFEPVRVPQDGLQLHVALTGSAHLRFREATGDVEIIGVPGQYLTRTHIDSSGETVLRGLPLGVHPVLVRTASSQEEHLLLQVTSPEDQPRVRDVELRPGTPVRLVVQDQLTGTPVSHVIVELERVGRSTALVDLPPELRLTVDAAGAWSGNLSRGEWRATVDDPAIVPDDWAHAEFGVSSGPCSIVVPVKRAKAVTGSVRYEDGTQAREATVAVTGEGIDDQFDVTAQSRFVARLPPATSGVSLVARDKFGNASLARRVEFGAADIENIDLILPASGAAVTGNLVDEDGVPMPSALVQCGDTATASDHDGHFRLGHVPPGRAVLAISRCGGLPRFHEVVLAPGESLDIGATQAGARATNIRGRVLVSGLSRAGVPVRVVAILPDDARLDAATTTAADGQYAVLAPQARHVTASCWLPGYSWDSSSTSVEESDAVLDLELVRRTTALLGVRGKDTAPDWVEVAVATESGFEDLQSHWDRVRGQALFAISRGPRRLRVSAPGLAPAVLEVSIASEEETNLGEVRLRVGGRVAGQVLDVSGRPISGVVVWLGRDILQTVTVEDGRFEFEHAPPGEWACEAYTSDSGHAGDVASTVRVVDGGDTQLTLRTDD